MCIFIRSDETENLGSGAFGNVSLASIVKNGNRKQVAAKSVHLEGTDVSVNMLKCLLMEIKVLSFLGQHENIVSLMGAYTSEIQTGMKLVISAHFP